MPMFLILVGGRQLIVGVGYEHLDTDRVGGELALTPLPHHRTCGSAYGGSTSALEAPLRFKQREQPQVREVGGRQRVIRVGSTRIPPRPPTVPGAAPGALRIQPQPAQALLSCPRPFPLPPQQAAQAPNKTRRACARRVAIVMRDQALGTWIRTTS